MLNAWTQWCTFSSHQDKKTKINNSFNWQLNPQPSRLQPDNIPQYYNCLNTIYIKPNNIHVQYLLHIHFNMTFTFHTMVPLCHVMLYSNLPTFQPLKTFTAEKVVFFFNLIKHESGLYSSENKRKILKCILLLCFGLLTLQRKHGW